MTDNTYILEFSKESNDAVTEILRAAEDLDQQFSVMWREGHIAIVKGNFSTIEEMSFLNFASRYLGSFNSLDELKALQLPEGSFHVRINDIPGTGKFSEAEIGEAVKGKRKVTFSNPDFIVRTIHTDRWHIGVLMYQIDLKGINKRRAPLRPFFSPVTVHPKYARFLINLSRTTKGSVILDPFCGTGGILIEAHLMSRRVIGSDASLNMVKGCRMNMRYFGIPSRVMHSDFLDLKLQEKPDAIITDLPYGRSSELHNHTVEELKDLIFPKFSEILESGKYISFITSDSKTSEKAEEFFELVSKTPFKQHRSLTRYFVSMKRY